MLFGNRGSGGIRSGYRWRYTFRGLEDEIELQIKYVNMLDFVRNACYAVISEQHPIEEPTTK